MPVTKLLKESGIDSAMHNQIILMREKIDDCHTKWYSEAVSFCQKFEIEEHVKQWAGKQTLRENMPSESPSEYFKRTLTIPLLDHINSELFTRFNESSIAAYSGLCIVPVKMADAIRKVINWKEKFHSFVNLYKDDLPNPLALPGELEVWGRYRLDHKGNRPHSIAATLKSINCKKFENLNIALRILGTIPVK